MELYQSMPIAYKYINDDFENLLSSTKTLLALKLNHAVGEKTMSISLHRAEDVYLGNAQNYYDFAVIAF